MGRQLQPPTTRGYILCQTAVNSPDAQFWQGASSHPHVSACSCSVSGKSLCLLTVISYPELRLVACLLHHIFLGDTTRAFHLLFLVSPLNTQLRVVSVTHHGVSLGAYHPYAMLHKEGEIFSELRLRTAHMVSNKVILAMKRRSLPPPSLSPYLPSPLPSLSPLGTFSLFLSQSNLDIYHPHSYP